MSTHAPLDAVARAALAEEVASVVRHDVRNRLAAIGQAATYLRRRMEKTDAWSADSRVESFFDLIRTEITAANAILADGLQPAARVSRAPSEISLDDSVELGLASLPPQSDVAIERALGARTPLWADAHELALMVQCIAQNAVEAARAGTRPAAVQVTTLDSPGGVVLVVVDSGPGFERGLEEPLRPFASSKPGHAGIGLNIARRIAQRYAARLSLATRDEGGAAVMVCFEPRAQP
jgi:nitrogen fixation/metabolism regulation signal transduction histidine kinase